MANLEAEVNPEQLSYIKEIIEDTTGLEFDQVFAAFQKFYEGLEDTVTEEDLIADILEAGGHIRPVDAVYEDMVIIGTHIIGETIYLFDYQPDGKETPDSDSGNKQAD